MCYKDNAFSYRKKQLGGGITLDVGVYTIQFCQLVLQSQPESVRASGIVNDDGVDVEATAEITYPGNKMAKFRISALNTFENTAKIHGTKGILTVSIKDEDVSRFLNVILVFRCQASSFRIPSLTQMEKKQNFHNIRKESINFSMRLHVA